MSAQPSAPVADTLPVMLSPSTDALWRSLAALVVTVVVLRKRPKNDAPNPGAWRGRVATALSGGSGGVFLPSLYLGAIAGGLYGIGVGAMYGAESMFHRVSDASKVAMVALMAHAQAIGLTLVAYAIVTIAFWYFFDFLHDEETCRVCLLVRHEPPEELELAPVLAGTSPADIDEVAQPSR